jgi:hypothetical protein
MIPSLYRYVYKEGFVNEYMSISIPEYAFIVFTTKHHNLNVVKLQGQLNTHIFLISCS